MFQFKRNLLKVVTLLAVVLQFGCSNNSSGTKAGESTIDTTTVYGSISTQLGKAASMSDVVGSASIVDGYQNMPDIEILAAPNFSTDWTNATLMPNQVTGTGNVSPKDFVGRQLTPNLFSTNGSGINVFSRMKTVLGIFCSVGLVATVQGISVSNGYPAAGTYTVTFTDGLKASMTSTCGVNVSNMPTGATVNLVVTEQTGSYVRKYAFSGPFTMDFYVKYDTSVINIAAAETGSNGVSRTMLYWDKTTNIMRTEYYSGPGGTAGNGLYIYRLFYDETNDDGQILVFEGNTTSENQSTRFILAGKPSTGDAYSLSMKSQNLVANAMCEACVASSSGNILTDGSRCVATTLRTNGAAVTSVDALITAMFAQKTATTWYSALSTSSLAWTDKSNMLTAAVAP